MKRFGMGLLVAIAIAVGGYVFREWVSLPVNIPLYVESEVMADLDYDPFTSRIFADFPERREQLAATLIDAYETDGRRALEGSLVAEMAAVGEAVMPHYLVRASETDLVAYYQVMADMTSELPETDPERCANFYLGNTMSDGTATVDFRVQSISSYQSPLELATKQLFTNASQDPISFDNQSAQISLGAVRTALLQEVDPQTMDLIGQTVPVATRDDQIAYCNGLNFFMSEILRLPTEEAANLLRSF